MLQLFDTDNEVNKNSLKYIFTTEGHLIKLDPSLRHSAWEEFSIPRPSSDSCYENCNEDAAVAKTNQPFVTHSVSTVFVLPVKKGVT